MYIYCGGVPIFNRAITGYNGGGRPGLGRPFSGGGGGGSTDIRIGGTTLEHRVIVAGGGGGAGGGNINGINVFGGDGGGTEANDGNGYGSDSNKGGGKGGTQSTGGSGGFSWFSNAGDGEFGIGGNADYLDNSYIAGGGGGGGYFGGGGGIGAHHINSKEFFGGGGGGSSYTDPDLCTNVNHTLGYAHTSGKITIRYPKARITYVPDDNFEAYLERIGLGDGVEDNDHVLTERVAEFDGELTIYNQNISDLTGIEDFTALTHLLCHNNQIEVIDVSENENLIYLLCMNNPPLHSVDLRNGNNHNMNNFQAFENPNLECIFVDNSYSFPSYFEPERLNIDSNASLCD